MKKTLRLASSTIILMSCTATISFAQLQWKKGGNNNTPAGLTLGTATGNNNPLAIITNGTERMRITPAGRVAIGTTNPQSLLHIHDGLNTFSQFTNTGSGTAAADGFLVGINASGNRVSI